MYRVGKAVLVLLLVLGAALAVAQAQPVDPLTPAPEMEPAPDIPDVAWVRFLHAAPNAPEISVNLAPTNEEAAAGFSGDAFESTSYGSFSEFVEVPAGNYEVSASGVDGVMAEEFSFARGNYYTLAAMGMVLPSEVQAEQEEGEQEEGGFVGFFRNLFGNGGGDRDRLALHFQLIDDDLTRTPNEGETLVRVVHAAPGTEAVDLAVIGEQGTIVDRIQFGNSSRYASYEGSLGDLELRVSGSRAATLDVQRLDLQAGNLNTIYVVGTPVEAAPLELLGSSIAPVQAGMPPGDDALAGDALDDGEAAGGGGAEDGAGDDAEEGAGEGDADGAEGDAVDDAEEGAENGAADGAEEGEAAGEEADDAEESGGM